jgi:hypothetical protein
VDAVAATQHPARGSGPLEPIGPPTGSSGIRARLDRWRDVGSG